MKINALEWLNFNKYKAQNEALATIKYDNRIVFMGDSITEFWNTADPSFFEEQHYINRGISGQTTPQILLRFRADVIALEPDIVHILAGVNDIAGNSGPTSIEMIAGNIFSMAELANSHSIKVILCSVLPAYDFPWSTNQNPAEKIIALNKLIKAYALEHNMEYIDYFTAMKDNRNGLQAVYSEDGVHPNKVGYQVMAPLAQHAIQKISKQNSEK
ncbi:MAG: SGNH/GDSL hydrolase family protein [Flavobacterium sp.]